MTLKSSVVEYTYDPWGKCTIFSGTSNCNLGTLNPFRYRGYYYDEDTGLYYLQSRYYDCNTCKFINIDDVSVVYSYPYDIQTIYAFDLCGFNPVMYIDPNGFRMRLFTNDIRTQKLILRNLNLLTDHTLFITKDRHIEIKTRKTKNLKYSKGNQLITRLIDSSFTCTILTQTQKGNYTTFSNISNAQVQVAMLLSILIQMLTQRLKP